MDALIKEWDGESVIFRFDRKCAIWKKGLGWPCGVIGIDQRTQQRPSDK